MAYFYEHVNGSVIRKPDFVVDSGGGPHDYFNSGFVLRWWHKEDEQQKCKNHPDRPKRVTLDGEPLCQECCDAWARDEGYAQQGGDT